MSTRTGEAELSERIDGFLRDGLGKSDEEIEQLRDEWGEVLEYPEKAALPDTVDDEDMDAVVEMLEEAEENEGTGETEEEENTGKSAEIRELEKQIEEIEARSERINEVLEKDPVESGVEVLNEDVPVLSVHSVAMMPTELVHAWLEDLVARLSSVVEVAERREKKRQELAEDLEDLEDVMESVAGSNWTVTEVDKAYKTQEKLVNDGQYCALGPDFAARLGASEGDKVRVRKTSNRAKAAVYTVYEVREQDAQLRIAKKGRKRIDGKGSFSGEITVI